MGVVRKDDRRVPASPEGVERLIGEVENNSSLVLKVNQPVNSENE